MCNDVQKIAMQRTLWKFHKIDFNWQTKKLKENGSMENRILLEKTPFDEHRQKKTTKLLREQLATRIYYVLCFMFYVRTS